MDKEIDDLELLAKQVMLDKGLQPDFSKEELQQLNTLEQHALQPSKNEDLRSLLWCSIDNDDSRDLDQLNYAQKGEDSKTTIWVAIADVDDLVPKDSPIDIHAQINTTSVYTPTKIFPMLPEKLSTDLTSLNENEDRMALVIKFKIDQDGEIEETSIFQAIVHNYAKLTYSAVGAWLEKRSDIPDKVKQVAGLEQALRCQHEAAQTLKRKRHLLGALTLQSIDPEAKITKDKKLILELPTHNYAHELIEHFMIAANSVVARHFSDANIPSLRRVVRIPKRWDRIIQIAKKFDEILPPIPDSKALDDFLIKRKNLSPETFPDLSLTIIKLLGRGEYIVEVPGDKSVGHFGLALSEYAHTTAPNRRFPDLIAQRQYKSYLMGKNSPYDLKQLQRLADHCTKQEDAAAKVERHMIKSAAAMWLSSQIGNIFEGIITGIGKNGSWVRIFQPPVEGKIVRGLKKMDVGDRVLVKLISIDIPNGYIDFVIP